MLPAALAGVLALGGCFRPMLAEGEPSVALMGRIAYPAFDDRFGYYLNDSLRDRLGRPNAPAYQLVVRTRTNKDDLAIAQDNSVTRISLTATADWALYRITDDIGDAAKPQPQEPESLIGGHRQTSPGKVLEGILHPEGPGNGGPKPLLSGRAISQSGYNSTASLFATRAAKLDIERRLARDLGERIARVILARAGQIAAADAAAPAGS